MKIVVVFLFTASMVLLSQQCQDHEPCSDDVDNLKICKSLFQGNPGLDGRDGRDGKNVFQEGSAPCPSDCQGLPGNEGPVGLIGHFGEDGLQGPVGPPGPPGTSNGTIGAVYIRWGRTTCPSTSDLVYEGIAGGSDYASKGDGSGVNYLCLPKTPKYDVYQPGVQTERGYIYSSEYETSDFPPFAGMHDHDVPCATCIARNRGIIMMIPATMNCTTGWTREYHGYLMSSKQGYVTTKYVCVDRHPEKRSDSSSASQDGSLFYPVECKCDNAYLPCNSYINGAELSCVVCTK